MQRDADDTHKENQKDFQLMGEGGEEDKTKEKEEEDDDDKDEEIGVKSECCSSETNELEFSDENDRPGERWAPVGANDTDDDFTGDFKSPTTIETLSYDMERMRMLEEEQEMLNSSLIALTTHFAQVQLRLRQIVDSPADQKETLLKELEEFAFRGIPDVSTSIVCKPDLSSPTNDNMIQPLNDVELDSKIAMHKTKQKELINQLKVQLEDLEKYAYETDGQELPQSIILEKQNMIINHLKEKLNFEVDDLFKLPMDDLRWQIDHSLNEIVTPLKMKEQLVNQLKTQVNDLERFIHYLQGEISTETLACTCACPVHSSNIGDNKSNKRYIEQPATNESNRTRTLNTVKKVVTLLHLYLMSQFGCSNDRMKNHIKKNAVPTWREIRMRLDIAVEHVLESINEVEHQNDSYCDGANVDDNYGSDNESVKAQLNIKITTAVRKHLAVSIRDLLQHGLTSDIQTNNSLVPFVGCFPQKRNHSNTFMHIWELIIKYYEIKNGHLYNSTPAQKLSQSFNLDLINRRNISPKQSLLITIGNIIATHTPYKRSYNAHFKAFVCAALNSKKLVPWLRLILQCQYLLENYYTSWSYVVKTGFQDAFHTLDRLTNIHFDLPVDLAVRQFQNIKDAF